MPSFRIVPSQVPPRPPPAHPAVREGTIRNEGMRGRPTPYSAVGGGRYCGEMPRGNIAGKLWGCALPVEAHVERVAGASPHEEDRCGVLANLRKWAGCGSGMRLYPD